MKKFIIGILALIGVFAVYFIWKAKKTIQTADLLDFDIADFKLNFTLRDLPGVLLSWSVPATVTIKASNYSKHNFTIEQMKADIYTPDNSLLAYQDNPFSEDIIIKPKGTSLINIDYTLDLSGIVKMIAARKKQNPDAKLLKEVLTSYITKGEIGETVLIKGFVIPKELGIKVKLNEEVEF